MRLKNWPNKLDNLIKKIFPVRLIVLSIILVSLDIQMGNSGILTVIFLFCFIYVPIGIFLRVNSLCHSQLTLRRKFFLSAFFPLFFYVLSIFSSLIPVLKDFSEVMLICSLSSALVLPLYIIISILHRIFKSWKNFKTTLAILLVITTPLYIFSLEYRLYRLFGDYGGYEKILCSETISKFKTKNSVVRIVGGYSEGSGFFFKPDQVLTNHHVIDGELSPKVILPNGKFLYPQRIEVYKEGDLAIIHVNEEHPELVLDILMGNTKLSPNESIIAVGFPMGTDIKGGVTVLKGTFLDFRNLKGNELEYIQTSIPLVQGMSGGPAVDSCGKVVGVNTLAVSGMSFLIRMSQFGEAWARFTPSTQTLITLDSRNSPEEAVEAFYMYLKARDMKSGFASLSQEYLSHTNFEEWTSRFPDVIDVEVFQVYPVERKKNQVAVKFGTANWNNGEVVRHFYEGTWTTILEDDHYKLLRSHILEVPSPSFSWFSEY